MIFYISFGTVLLFFVYSIIKKRALGSIVYKCKALNCLYPRRNNNDSYIESWILGILFLILFLDWLLLGEKSFEVYKIIRLGIVLLFFIYSIIRKTKLVSTAYKLRFLNFLHSKDAYSNTYILGWIFVILFLLLLIFWLLLGEDLFGFYAGIYFSGFIYSIYRVCKLKPTLSIHNDGISFFLTTIKWEDISKHHIEDEMIKIDTYNQGYFVFKYNIKHYKKLKCHINNMIKNNKS